MIERSECLLFEAGMPTSLRGEAIKMSTYLINHTFTKSIDGIPNEIFHRKPVNIANLRVIGCRVMVMIHKSQRDKWAENSREMFFVGFDENAKAFRCYEKGAKKIYLSHDVIFHENTLYRHTLNNQPDNLLIDVSWLNDEESDDENQEETENEEEDNAENTQEDDNNDETNGADETPESQTSSPSADGSSTPTGSGRKPFSGRMEIPQDNNCVSHPSKTRSGSIFGNIFGGNTFAAIISDPEYAFSCVNETIDDPVTYQDVVHRDDQHEWEIAMEDEMKSLEENHTWILVPRPPGKTIKCRWIFKTKISADGVVEKRKARLVAKGFTQTFGTDYHETFAPVVRYASIRIMIAIAAQRKMKLFQMDVKTAFLNGDIEECIHMEQPEGYNDNSGRVCKLQKSLYGLKQAGRNWNKKLDEVLTSFGLKKSSTDQCIYFNHDMELFIPIYVDDLLIVAKSDKHLASLKKTLCSHFKMTDLGLAHSIIGLRVNQKANKIEIDQSVYIAEVLKRFGMDESHPMKTPVDTNLKRFAV